MKKHKNWVASFNDLALSVLLVLGIALVITVLVINPPQSSQIAETQPYPLPKSAEATLDPRVKVIFAENVVPETPIYGETGKPGNAYPQPPSYPTFTPFPSPTLRPGTTATAIPLPIIGVDAAGDIRYFFVQDSQILIESLAVDSVGAVKGAPVQIASTSLESISGKSLFLSPDGRLLSIVGEWGAGVILDTLDGKITPFSENLILEGIFNWFPDSQHMLAEASRHSLWLIDPIRGDYSRLAVPGMGDIDSASASPDGRSIVYSHEFGSSTHLRIVDSDGRNDRMLLELKSRVTNLTWSPDNNKIAFRGEGWISLDLRDLSAVKLGVFPVVNCHFNTPSWSPDSRYLALVVSNVSLCEGSGEDLIKDANIVIFDVETGEHRTIRPDGETGNINPVWSPDSSRIVFISNYGGQPDLWSLNFKDASVDQITNQGRFFYLLSWQKSE